jgi:hypothetical protein
VRRAAGEWSRGAEPERAHAWGIAVHVGHHLHSLVRPCSDDPAALPVEARIYVRNAREGALYPNHAHRVVDLDLDDFEQTTLL